MKDELDRIATALESIAASLMKVANPPVVLPEPTPDELWDQVRFFRSGGGLRESGPPDYDRNGASD